MMMQKIEEVFSQEPTPWALLCAEDGQSFITEAEYLRQLDSPDDPWKCPICGQDAEFDQDNWEARSPDAALAGNWPELAALESDIEIPF